MLINILEDLYNGGADYVDISGDTDVDGNLRDTIKITVKPEYLSDTNQEDELSIEQELDVTDDNRPSLSEEDINELI